MQAAFTFYFSLFTFVALATVNQTCDEARAEAVINVDDRDVRRAGIEHSQKRRDAAERRAVTDACRNGDNRNFN